MEKIKKEILEIVTSDGLSDDDWKSISRMIASKQFFLASEADFWGCIYIVTNAFQAKQCQNMSIMSDVLRLAFLKNYYGDYLDSFLTTGNERHIRDILPLAADFYDIFSVPYDNPLSWVRGDYVIDTLLSGNVEFFKVLLNFGATILPSPGMRPYCIRVLEKLLHTYGYYTSLFDTAEMRLLYRHAESEEFEDMNRLFLFLINLDILTEILRTPEIAENVGRATRILFKSLPFTRLTNKEMRLLLGKFLGALPVEQLIDNVLKDYERYFPESADPCPIQSLRDLCRCRIREYLRTAKKISYGIPLLPLPKFLKEFILFETE